jgi:hypothetical protein
MKKIVCILAGAILFCSNPGLVSGQTVTQYDAHDLFNPYFFTSNGNEYRSANGAPGPKYWQNRSDYQIHATLNEQDTTVSGEVTIGYTNNSPDNLDYLWLQLDQNLFRPDSRGAATIPISGDRFDVKGFKKGGYQIREVTVTVDGKSYTVEPVISDARMQLRLKTPLRAGGGKVSVRVSYGFAIPVYGADRMGRLTTSNGIIYELAQWYPRMCVYDDVMGWNTLPYMGLGEFYCDYGNYDYYISAPAGMTVVGSGDLQNPQQVLTARQISRLATARNSDETVMIRDSSEVAAEASRSANNGQKTWHFNMKNTRDVSWAASRAFIWDAARVTLPSGRKAIAMSAYPVESSGADRYGRSTEYLKRSIELYSTKYYEYPWNSAVSVAGVARGMEYPGIIFCQSGLRTGQLWGDITHEIGHNWFPMLVGSNERRYMWMDEGFNTFINEYSTREFNHGEYYRKRAGRNAAPGLKRETDPLMTPPEAMGMMQYGLYYSKTAVALVLLRTVVLDSSRFDFAFNEYIKRWAFKHPQPEDFFRTMNDAAGEDLGWFWKEWFYTDWTLDQSVKDVKYVRDDPANGSLITIENLGKMAMPVMIQINEDNGQSQVLKFPVEIWQRGGTWTFQANTTSKISSVVLDPDHEMPDVNATNDIWKEGNSK